jgi:hypothetical protein
MVTLKEWRNSKALFLNFVLLITKNYDYAVLSQKNKKNLIEKRATNYIQRCKITTVTLKSALGF